MEKKLHILFVEDSPDDAELIVLHLVREGLQFNWDRVDRETSIREKLENNDYNIVISDYILPGMLGIEVVKLIKDIKPELPVIIISGQVGEEVAIQTLKAGASDYLMKDNLARLKSAIERAIQEKKLENSLKISQERYRLLSQYLEKVREKERTEIAMNLHDDLGQKLTALNIDVNWLKDKLKNADKLVQGKLKIIQELISESIISVQQISTSLRPSILDDLGLVSAIEWQVNEYKKKTNMECHFNVNQDNGEIDHETSVVVFRIFQEACTNILRHAEASIVNIYLKTIDDKLELILEDNGKGITEAEIDDPKSFGLFSMAERARNCNGKLTIEGKPGEGTKIHLTIPLK